MSADQMEPPLQTGRKPSELAPREHERVIDSRALFGQARAIRISHNGESYSLRLTRLGKLILTK
jgi:hemin uptake protein HemP